MGIAGDCSLAPLQCLLCGGLRHRSIFNEFGIDIVRCQKCQHVFSSFPSSPHNDGFWGNEVTDGDHFYWNQRRARMYGDFRKKFVAGRSGRLLDMGCGLGFFLKAMEPYTEWDAYGCEISAAAVRYAREKLGLQNVVCGQLENADLPQASFDIITMWDVIDHILRPDALLSHCRVLLRKGGICFIRTPNVSVQLLRARLKKAVRGMQPDLAYMKASEHLHQYSMGSIRRLLERNGFADVEFVHLHPVESATGSKGTLVRGIKNMCFETVRALAIVSGGHLNFDNLFVVARKEVQHGAPIRGQVLNQSRLQRLDSD